MIPDEAWTILYAYRFDHKKYKMIAREVRNKTGYYISSESVRAFYKRYNYEKMPASRKDFVMSYTPKKPTHYQKHSICWRCANSVPNSAKGLGCEWSVLFRPVRGWTAEYVPERKAGDNIIKQSYLVTECPKFIEELTEKEERYLSLKKDVADVDIEIEREIG